MPDRAGYSSICRTVENIPGPLCVSISGVMLVNVI